MANTTFIDAIEVQRERSLHALLKNETLDGCSKDLAEALGEFLAVESYAGYTSAQC